MSGVDRRFVYEVPAKLADLVSVGSIVRVHLQGRSVRAWVVALDVDPPPGVGLRPIDRVTSLGPPPEVVDLCTWTAWRYQGPVRLLLSAAGPQRVVAPAAGPAAVRAPVPAANRPSPPAVAASPSPPAVATSPSAAAGPERSHGQGARSSSAEVVAATHEALTATDAVLRLPPAAPRLVVVEAALSAVASSGGDLLVLVASTAEASILATRLRRGGRRVALLPDEWAAARAGGCTVIGARNAVFGPVGRLAAIVVLDAHADAYRSERAPNWWAPVVATERARREGAPCLMVSSCPSLELLAGRRLVTLSRSSERAGWAPVEVLDAGDEDPRSGGYPSTMASAIRRAANEDLERPVVAVLNRTGRARLVACPSCRRVLRCPECAAPLVQASLVRALSGAEPDFEKPPFVGVPPALEPTSESSPHQRLHTSAGGSTRVQSVLECPRCARSRGASCEVDGPVRPRVVRVAASRAAEDLAALTGLEVAEVTAASHDRRAPLPSARVLVGTEAVLQRVAASSLVVFLDFDGELVARRFRAGEQALALLALAARLVGGRRRNGRVLVRTRLVDDDAVSAAVHADPARLNDAEAPRRAMLRLPPESALAAISGDGAGELAGALEMLGGEVSEARGRFLVRADDGRELADLLAAARDRLSNRLSDGASTQSPPGRWKIEIEPRDL